MKRLITSMVIATVVVFLTACVPGLGFERPEGDDMDVDKDVEVGEAVFAYGTLLDPKVQQRIIGRTVESRPDVLPGYRKGTLKLSKNSYFIAVRDPDHSIEGGVLVVTESELERIDRYEGKHYERARVVLESGTEAWVYREWE